MTYAAPSIDAIDRRIVNALQADFPLVARPYAQMAARLGLEEEDLIARLRRLLENGALTRFGPFFDAGALGGAFCLCAMAVPAARFEEVAARVNARPQVAHNYARAHRLNMWFVLATETPAEIFETAWAIEEETDLKVHLFPKEREFFVGFQVAA
ncbi:MAG: Lrp/AsnC family transcriptional regulator [Pseudomonadota bacterium]